MRAVVSRAKVSVLDHGEERRKLATSSPDRAAVSPGGQFSAQHLGERRREPGVFGAPGGIVETDYSDGKTRGLTEGGCDTRTRLVSSAEVSRWYEATPAATSKARAKPKSRRWRQCALSG
jgi:hypothetical protein